MASETPMQTAPDHSPNEAITAHAGAQVNVNRITLPPARELILGALLAAAIIGLVAVHQEAKDAYTMGWLAQDQINKFMTNQEPKLESEIQTSQALIQAYGIKKSIHEEITHVRRDNHQQVVNPTHRSH